jgi:DNA-binding ferritin-like protein
MSSSETGSAIAALNNLLSELIDLVQDVKQAHRKVPENHALHSELDQLFADLRNWAEALMAEDQARGVSPLASMPTVAGRTPKNLWPSASSDETVRQTMVQHLERLSHHLSVALEQQDSDERFTSLLGQIDDQLRNHIQRLTLSER